MPPIFHEEDYWPTLYEIDKREFLDQCHALQALGGSSFLPEYVAHSEGKQSADGPYPGGYLFAFVMTRLEGILVKVSGIARSVPFVLSADDMRVIKESTINAHEYVATCFLLLVLHRGLCLPGDFADTSDKEAGRVALPFLTPSITRRRSICELLPLAFHSWPGRVYLAPTISDNG